MVRRTDLSRPFVRIEPGTNPARAIAFLYDNPALGDSRHYGKAMASDGLVTASQHANEIKLQQPQFREDQHGKGYCPTVSSRSWLRSDATQRPGFDHSPRRGQERR